MRTYVWTGAALSIIGVVVVVLAIIRAFKTFTVASFESLGHTMVLGLGLVVIWCLMGIVLYVHTSRWFRFLLGIITSLCVVWEVSYTYFSFLVPDFHAEGNKLVHGNVVLVPIQSNIVKVPSSFPFWTRIGYADGGRSLYRFTFQGREYVFYGDRSPIIPPLIYEYTTTNGN